MIEFPSKNDRNMSVILYYGKRIFDLTEKQRSMEISAKSGTYLLFFCIFNIIFYQIYAFNNINYFILICKNK